MIILKIISIIYVIGISISTIECIEEDEINAVIGWLLLFLGAITMTYLVIGG